MAKRQAHFKGGDGSTPEHFDLVKVYEELNSLIWKTEMEQAKKASEEAWVEGKQMTLQDTLELV